MNVKEVKVSLTEADIKKTESRPRRRTRKVGGQTADVNTEIPVAPTPAPSISNTMPDSSASVQETPSVITTTANTQATLSSTTTATTTIGGVGGVGGVGASAGATAAGSPTTQTGGIQIKTRKRTHGSLLPPTPVTSKSLAARILPIKRHALPSKVKPKLRVPVQAGGQETAPAVIEQTLPQTAPTTPIIPPITLAPTASITPVTSPTVSTEQAIPATPATSVTPTPAPVTGGKRAIKRRFTERRIGISVKSLKTTRKARKSIRKQVASMSVPEIRKVLTEKGILKGKTNPPETMLRSLMKDYLSLKH